MNVRICNIATEMVSEGIEIPIYVHELLAKCGPNDNMVAKDLYQIRRLMLEIILRLNGTKSPEQIKLMLDADQFWDGSMLEHFVEDAENLMTTETVKTLYREVHKDEGQPLNDFLNRISGTIDQDMGYFLYDQLCKEEEQSKIA